MAGMGQDQIAALITAFASDDYMTRHKAKHELITFGAAAVDALAALLDHEDGQIVWAAAGTLAQMEDERIPALFLSHIHTPHLLARQIIVQALGKWQYTPALSAFIELLHSEKVTVTVLAIEALGKLGDARAVDPLLMTLAAADSNSVRLECIRALGRVGDPRVIEAIAPYQDHDDDHIRKRAAIVVSELQEQR